MIPVSATTSPSPPTTADTGRHNNFGVLRLAFALCVLVSHSVELIDGNRSREPLTWLFGTLSSGEVGVDGFFLISGYLVTQSFESSRSTAAYLIKRLLRIYPAYLVAFLLSLLIVAPLAGADMSALKGSGWLRQIRDMLVLAQPVLPNAFSGLHYPVLNGPMWTIAHEFRCYLLVILIGLSGLIRARTWLAILTVALLVASASGTIAHLPTPFPALTGLPRDTIRLSGIFLTGAAFYAYRDHIPYRNDLALAAAAALIAGLFFPRTAEIAMALAGGYLIFWFAFLKNTPTLNRINSEKLDLSYGIYLAAWPIQNLAIKYIPGITPLPLMALTAVLSAAFAWASWTTVEAPCLRLKSRFASKPRPVAATIS